MDLTVAEVQHAPVRQVLRDRSGIVVGVIEQQRLTGKEIARDERGIVVGTFDGHSTRDAHGRILATTNILPALLFSGR